MLAAADSRRRDAARRCRGPGDRSCRLQSPGPDSLRSRIARDRRQPRRQQIDCAKHELKALEIFGGRWYALTVAAPAGAWSLRDRQAARDRRTRQLTQSRRICLSCSACSTNGAAAWGWIPATSGDSSCGASSSTGDLAARGQARCPIAAMRCGRSSWRPKTIAARSTSIPRMPARGFGSRGHICWRPIVACGRTCRRSSSRQTSPEAQYLAHLLRGTSAERERNATSALAEYEAARLAAPDSQTACLAVSSAQALNGQVGESRTHGG